MFHYYQIHVSCFRSKDGVWIREEKTSILFILKPSQFHSPDVIYAFFSSIISILCFLQISKQTIVISFITTNGITTGNAIRRQRPVSLLCSGRCWTVNVSHTNYSHSSLIMRRNRMWEIYGSTIEP